MLVLDGYRYCPTPDTAHATGIYSRSLTGVVVGSHFLRGPDHLIRYRIIGGRRKQHTCCGVGDDQTQQREGRQGRRTPAVKSMLEVDIATLAYLQNIIHVWLLDMNIKRGL